MNQLAPVAYFVYNSPEHTKISLNALKNNELAKHTRIIIYSVAPKNSLYVLLFVSSQYL